MKITIDTDDVKKNVGLAAKKTGILLGKVALKGAQTAKRIKETKHSKKSIEVNTISSVSYVPAVCTQCGAHLEVNPSEKSAVCQYCGTTFSVEKAIQNINAKNAHIHADKVEINKKSNYSATLDFISERADKRNQLKAERIRRKEEEKKRREKKARNAIIGCTIVVVLCFLGLYMLDHPAKSHISEQSVEASISEKNLEPSSLPFSDSLDDSVIVESTPILPSVGSSVNFGSYFTEVVAYETGDAGAFEEPIEWVVIDQDSQNNKVLIVSTKAIDAHAFSETNVEKDDWEHCNLRFWLNHNFIEEAFSDDEKKRIEPTLVPVGSDFVTDSIFILSADEARNYHVSNRIEGTNYAGHHGATLYLRYWIKHPVRNQKNWSHSTYGGFYYCTWVFRPTEKDVDHVLVYSGKDGASYTSGSLTEAYGIRPSLWLKY